MKTRRVFVAVLAVVAAVALAQSSMRNEAAARTPSGPRAVHRESRASQLPVKNYGLGIAYYSVRGGLRTSLTLNNKGPAALFPAVTLYARDGRRHRMDGLTVNGRSFLELDLRDLTAAAGPGFEDGSLRVAYSGRALELGGMLTMTDLETGVEWYDQLMYEAAARSNRLEGVWWLPNEATEARLVVTNGSTDPVDVRVTFNGTTPARTESFRLGSWQLQVLDFGKPAEPGSGPRYGRLGGISIEYTGAPGGVLARGFVSNTNAGYSSVVALDDPALAKTSRHHAGGVRVVPVGGATMEPVIVARNVGSAGATVTGRLQITGPGGELITEDLPTATLAPGETRVMDARLAWSRAAELSTEPTAGLELQHDGAPGSVVFAAASVSQDLTHVFHVPLTDPETLPSATGGYFWRVESSRTSLVVLKNMTDEPQRYNLEIRYEGGVWAPGLRVIPPHQSEVLAVGAIQAAQVPDAKGRTIPMTATRGQVHWSGGGPAGRAIVGRMEHVDLANGVSSTYACPMPTNDIFVDAWIDPGYWEFAAGDTVPFVVWEQDEDAFGGGLQSPYEITDILTWSSWDSGVASIVGPGHVYGVAEGFTGINASGESNGWEYYAAEEQPENHVPISLFADAQVRCAVPENLRHEGKTNLENGGIRVQIKWDPPPGLNYGSLDQCRIGERLTWTSATWPLFPSGPFGANPNYPSGGHEQLLGEASVGFIGILDEHSTDVNQLHNVDGIGTITQRYLYRCPCDGNVWRDISGPYSGPHDIQRKVWYSMVWLFQTVKGNDSSDLYVLPN